MVVDVVVVDDSWATAALAGTRNTADQRTRDQLRVPRSMPFYRRNRARRDGPSRQFRSGREFVPRGVGVEKPARGGAPTISSGRTGRHSSPSRRGFPPPIRSSPPRVVDNVTPVAAPDTIPGRFLPHRDRTRRDVALRREGGRRRPRSSPSTTTPTRPPGSPPGLRALGVGPGDRVVMLIGNRPEFHVADIAVLLLGATPISIYNSSSPEQIAYLAGHAEASVAIVEDATFLDRVLEVRADLPALRHLVAVETGRRARASSRGASCARPRRSDSRPPPRSPSRTTSRPSSTRRAPPVRPRA